MNDPYTINNEEQKANWSSMTATERSNALQAMWRNKAISDTYEPGSTFKLVTASTASIKKGIVQTTDKKVSFVVLAILMWLELRWNAGGIIGHMGLRV